MEIFGGGIVILAYFSLSSVFAALARAVYDPYGHNGVTKLQKNLWAAAVFLFWPFLLLYAFVRITISYASGK